MSDDSDDDLDGRYRPEQRHDFRGNRADALIEAILEEIFDDVINMLFDHPEIINEPGGPTQCTALQTASLTGQVEIVRFLLENGADVHKKGAKDCSPIHFASIGGDREVVELLLAYGANVHDRDSLKKNTPITLAVRRNNTEVVKILLAHGANPHDRDFPANHPLHKACSGGRYEMVQILLDHGANLYDSDDNGRMPLHLSCEGPNIFCDPSDYSVPIVRLLLENGADPNRADRNGRYILEDLRCSIPVKELIYETITVEWRGKLRRLLEVLFDYGAGTGLPCRLEDEANHSKCNTTVLMCCFLTLRREAVRYPLSSTFWDYEEVRDSFEGHFIRINAAGLDSSNDEKPFEPPEKDLDWSESRRNAYRVQCEEELRRLKTEMIADTSATYFSLLSRDLPVLLGQDKWGKLTRKSCVRQFPIYGNMLHCSYLRTLRPILETLSSEFFTILSPSLLADCAELVMSFLSNRDLESLVALCEAYQAFLQRRSSEVPN